MLARTTILSVFAALAATSFAAETEPYFVSVYSDRDCQDLVGSEGSADNIDCEDLENEYSVPIRSIKFEHPRMSISCGFQVGYSKDDNTCFSWEFINVSDRCYNFPGNPGGDAPEIKSFYAWKLPCPE
ncbi:hypothetical protein FBEOM_13898 [Fusarium beomiforme]|uniref:Uncharacterized protein n=1 Tax=Fusarium beomiforme TaxID=44412 RepID=A0A9P5A638_9HYPO|nr:hypothetical protein FBEOM_13898 [Fusarium beomiforme]